MNKSKKKKPFEYLFYDFVKITAGLPGMIWFRPKVFYENEKAKQKIKGGALLIANHRGYLDPISLQFCIWYRRHNFVCLNTFFQHPVSAWLFKRFHCIPVDRENFSMATLREIVNRLKEEKLVTMFPEGHMVIEGNKTDSFKSGMVLMSAMSKKPIIPVYLAPRKHFYSRIYMVLGEPVHIADAYGAMPNLLQMEEITQKLHEHEERLHKIFEEKGI